MEEKDPWVINYEQAKCIADGIVTAVQERNLKYPNGGPESSRITAAARRQIGTLGTSVGTLQAHLESDNSISELERNRRRDLVTTLRTRREQLLQALKRGEQSNNRKQLLSGLGGSNGNLNGHGRETESTASLDNQGLLQLQRDVMREQDDQLEELEKTVTSTRHIALAVNEELTLHNRLLEELDDDVDVVQSRMRTAQKRLQYVLRRSGGFKSICFMILLIAVLVLVVILAFKLLL